MTRVLLQKSKFFILKKLINCLKYLKLEDGIFRLAQKIKFFTKQRSYINAEKVGNVGGDKIAHVTYHIVANTGDTVLSQCVRKTLQQVLLVKEWELINIRHDVTQEEIDLINQCKKLIIGGGGLFLPDTNENTISGWQWAISPNDLQKITAKICVYSVGYNYFRGQTPSPLFIQSLNILVEKSSFFGLRNVGSVNAVKELVSPQFCDKIVYQPCTTTLARILFKEQLATKKETKNIAINMAFDREERRYGDNDSKNTILNQVAVAIKAIENKGYKIHYVCHCRDDDRFLPYLKTHMVHYKLTDLSAQFPDKVFDFYNKMDLVLGMRGHAQMIPFGLNCEIISLGTHDKMKWFLEDIDALDWYIDLQRNYSNISDIILNKFCDIHEVNHNNTLERLLYAQNKLWDITCHNLDVINKL